MTFRIKTVLSRTFSTNSRNKLMYLINPALDGHLSSYPNDYAFPPLGVIQVATQVHKTTDWKVKIFDAQITPHNEIIEQMKKDNPAVVGLSVLAETYNNSITFAEEARKIGATTLFGNDQAAILGKNILKKKECVLHVCTAEYGELFIKPYLDFIDGKIPIEQVPFLYYRKDGQVTETPVQEFKFGREKYKLDRFPIPDRTLISPDIWKIYAKNYNTTYGHLHKNEVLGVTTINRGRGCNRGNGSARCAYCGILDLSTKVSSPQKFWEDVQQAHDDINAQVFYEVFDSLSSVPIWVRSLIDARPKHLEDKQFFVYAQAKDVNRDVIKLYNEFNVCMLNMGLDSGNDVMLKRLKGKNDSVAANRNALILIKEGGMAAFGSFVLGSIGESQESLKDTVNFCKWIVDNGLAAALEAQPLMVRCNSRIGKYFDNPNAAELDMFSMGLKINNLELLKETSKTWKNEDIIDTPLMSDIYTKCFTNVTYQELIDAANEIVSYSKSKGISCGSVGIREDYVPSA